MQNEKYNILVWLPSPMGDAVLCTPALRSIRSRFATAQITFMGNSVVRSVLSPSEFYDSWIEPEGGVLGIASQLKAHNFTHAILFKNSFAAALSVFLAKIPFRIGYVREHRGPLLTEKLLPARLPNGKFRPASMLDYYLAIADQMGCDTENRLIELQVDENDKQSLDDKLPELAGSEKPLVVMVPGGAFGPSKCWPAENFAKTADRLVENRNAAVVISVAPDPLEKQIADDIYGQSSHNLINLAEHPLSLGELKALYSTAAIVITNDTGPRHIAIALGRKVITLFGPNDPAWTETDCENEIQIVGNVPCAPCAKSKCRKSQHFCMQAITVDTVCSAAEELLTDRRTRPVIFVRPKFEEVTDSFIVDPAYKLVLAKAGLDSIDAAFAFDSARSLTKSNLAAFRSRLQFEIDDPQSECPLTLFMKRFDKPPLSVQLKNRLSHRAFVSCAACEFAPAQELPIAGVRTPRVVAYGEQCSGIFEKRSFIITEKIPDAEALERKLPDCFNAPQTRENLKLRRDFIARLGAFIAKFHQTGYRHRDLYFSHIFCSSAGEFYLID
ncbi:MAG: lipopolysaccharide heptosyltransferase II, partial [Planctomycetota bacterium]